jgi:2'-5' RNA ligase
MALRGLGAFPNVHTPRVAWVGIDEGSAALVELAAKVEGACEQHGFPSESRPFRAHLTLGRARRPAPNPPLASAIEGMAGADLGEAAVDRILLMESRLTPRGAQYEVLEEHLLNHGEAE